MRFSARFLNFAASISIGAALLLLTGCQGRTTDNMVPDGDTIEVVVMQQQADET